MVQKVEEEPIYISRPLLPQPPTLGLGKHILLLNTTLAVLVVVFAVERHRVEVSDSVEAIVVCRVDAASN